MKKLFAFFAGAFLFVGAFGAFAADYEYATLLSITSHSGTITNGATSNYTAVANVRKADVVGIMTKLQLNGAGTDGSIFKFKKSVDGTNFESTPSILITNAANGTTAAYYFNQVTVSGARAIQLSSVVNGTSGQALTNVFVQVGIPARGAQ
jgi:hypothetical protein